MGDTSAGFKARYFKSTTIDPSDTFGAARPVPAAFFAIQSLAFSRLSSVFVRIDLPLKTGVSSPSLGWAFP
jgi:hypothetical protein